MFLNESLPRSLREQLGLGSPELDMIATEFAPLSVKLRIWSFVEMIDSRLTVASDSAILENATSVSMKVSRLSCSAKVQQGL
jgi:hypothetical protein